MVNTRPLLRKPNPPPNKILVCFSLTKNAPSFCTFSLVWFNEPLKIYCQYYSWNNELFYIISKLFKNYNCIFIVYIYINDNIKCWNLLQINLFLRQGKLGQGWQILPARATPAASTGWPFSPPVLWPGIRCRSGSSPCNSRIKFWL